MKEICWRECNVQLGVISVEMIINITVGVNDWVGVERKKELDQGQIPGGPHAGGQQDVRVCCLP